MAFRGLAESLFLNPRGVGAFLLVTAGVLTFGELRGGGRRSLGEVRLLDALVVGAGQGCAICPGLSRSGTTIAAALLCGLQRPAAARFAFLVSIPAVLGAGLVEVPHLLAEGWTEMWWCYIVGVVTAAVAGYGAIGVVMRLVERQRLRYFAVYCFIVGLAVVLLLR